MTFQTETDAWIIRDADAEKVQDGEFSALTLLADGEHTAGALTVNRARLETGSPGAPPHRHLRATETIYVLDGSLDVLVDEDVQQLGAGDMVVLPPGTTHAFAPTKGHPADMLAGELGVEGDGQGVEVLSPRSPGCDRSSRPRPPAPAQHGQSREPA